MFTLKFDESGVLFLHGISQAQQGLISSPEDKQQCLELSHLTAVHFLKLSTSFFIWGTTFIGNILFTNTPELYIIILHQLKSG